MWVNVANTLAEYYSSAQSNLRVFTIVTLACNWANPAQTFNRELSYSINLLKIVSTCFCMIKNYKCENYIIINQGLSLSVFK